MLNISGFFFYTSHIVSLDTIQHSLLLLILGKLVHVSLSNVFVFKILVKKYCPQMHVAFIFQTMPDDFDITQYNHCEFHSHIIRCTSLCKYGHSYSIEVAEKLNNQLCIKL